LRLFYLIKKLFFFEFGRRKKIERHSRFEKKLNPGSRTVNENESNFFFGKFLKRDSQVINVVGSMTENIFNGDSFLAEVRHG
jgi:hypothetical protein